MFTMRTITSAIIRHLSTIKNSVAVESGLLSMRRQIIRFLLGGGLNTALTYAIYLVLNIWTGYIFAYSIAYVCGIVLSYFINSLWVFNEKARMRSFLLYPIVYLVQYLLGVVLLYIFVDTLGIHQSLAPLVVIAATLPVTFILSRYILSLGKSSQ